MDARQIIDYAAEDNAKDFREALYASIYDKVSAHMENMKQYVAQNLVTQEEKEDDDECVDKDDVKKISKKEVKKHEDDMHEEVDLEEKYTGAYYDPKYDKPDRSDQAAADFKRIMKKHGVKDRHDAEKNKDFQHEVLTKHAKKFGGTHQVSNHFGWSDNWHGASGPNWHKEEVELNELDSMTLSRYKQSATKDKNKRTKDAESSIKQYSTSKTHDPKEFVKQASTYARKISNRSTGIERAKTKLEKEKIDHTPKDSSSKSDIQKTLHAHGFTKGKTYRQKDGNLKDSLSNSPNGRWHITHDEVTDYHHPKLGTVSVGNNPKNKSGHDQVTWARHNKSSEHNRNDVIRSANKSRGSIFNSEGDTTGTTDKHLHTHLNNLRAGKHTALHSMHSKNYGSKPWTTSFNKEEVEDLREAVTRKHFQMVADLIKSHEDPAKRKELAQHHAEIFKQQNPRFDHAKFMKAAGASD